MAKKPAVGHSAIAEAKRVLEVEAAAILGLIDHLDDTFVSSKHALFEASEAGLQLEDLRSTNGTVVNGQEVEGVRLLHEGDRVEIGDTIFRVEAAR